MLNVLQEEQGHQLATHKPALVQGTESPLNHSGCHFSQAPVAQPDTAHKHHHELPRAPYSSLRANESCQLQSQNSHATCTQSNISWPQSASTFAARFPYSEPEACEWRATTAKCTQWQQEAVGLHASQASFSIDKADQHLANPWDLSQGPGVQASLQLSQHCLHDSQADSLQLLPRPQMDNSQTVENHWLEALPSQHGTRAVGSCQGQAHQQPLQQPLPQFLHHSSDCHPYGSSNNLHQRCGDATCRKQLFVATSAHQPLHSLSSHQPPPVTSVDRQGPQAVVRCDQGIQQPCQASLPAIKGTDNPVTKSAQTHADSACLPGSSISNNAAAVGALPLAPPRNAKSETLSAAVPLPSNFDQSQNNQQPGQDISESQLTKASSLSESTLQGWKQAQHSTEVRLAEAMGTCITLLTLTLDFPSMLRLFAACPKLQVDSCCVEPL